MEAKSKNKQKCSNLSLEDYKDKAKEVLSSSTYEYVKKGSLRKSTDKLNKKAFKDILIRPHYFVNVSNITTSTTILGKDLALPVGIGPVAMQKVAHIDGEVASAQAAGAQGSIFILSSFSTASIEEVAEKAPDTVKWLQMYIFKNRSINIDFINRAEKAGYSAIVITVDSPVYGKTYLKYPDFDMPPNLNMSNFVGITDQPSQTVSSSFTIEDLKWILSSTKLPVIAKGILTKEGARIVRDAGCKGVIVSNHGGRQLDGTPSSIESLPEVVKAVGNDITVMFDSGIRGGDDIFKAIAFGAKYVFIGRPVFYGLAVDGQKGVEGVLDTLKQELENVMALSGCASLDDVKRDRVVHWKYYQGLLRSGDEL